MSNQKSSSEIFSAEQLIWDRPVRETRTPVNKGK